MNDFKVNYSSEKFNQIRFITKIAKLYYEEHLSQPEIAKKMHISQARVSRLIASSIKLGIVKTIVAPPPGMWVELEREIEDKYQLDEVIIAESDDLYLLNNLGSVASHYLEKTLMSNEILGISSWSSSLLYTIDSMKMQKRKIADFVVQTIGGLGAGSGQMQANRMMSRLAEVTGATPIYIPAPGIVKTEEIKLSLFEENALQEALSKWSKLTTVLHGIGSLKPTPLLSASGNTLSEQEVKNLKNKGAVGHVCLRYFDADGIYINSEINQRIIGISSKELKQVPRSIGIAAGIDKIHAIRGAIKGKWINVLITDSNVGVSLMNEGK